MQNLELLTAADVAVILKNSEATIWNWQYGRKAAPVGFPRPSKIGASLRWKSHEIDTFILGLPSATTGRIPAIPATEQPKQFSVPMPLIKPVRGRGRPRKVQVTLV